MSGSSSFSLADIEANISGKKRKSSTTPPPRALALRSGKKGKVKETVDLDAYSPENPPLIDFDVALTHGRMVFEQLGRAYTKKVNSLEESRKGDIEEINALRKQANEREVNHVKEVRELKSKLLEESSRHAQEIKDLTADAMENASKVILEARIKMAEEAANGGFDTSIWEVQAWKESLAELKGEDPKENKWTEAVEMTKELTLKGGEDPEKGEKAGSPGDDGLIN